MWEVPFGLNGFTRFDCVLSKAGTYRTNTNCPFIDEARPLPHSRFYCHFVFSVRSDFSRVMGARPSLLCYVHTILARPDIGANVYCHLIGRDDENILSACIDQSDDNIYLLRYLHTKQQRWLCTHHTAKIRFHRKNKMTIKP